MHLNWNGAFCNCDGICGWLSAGNGVVVGHNDNYAVVDFCKVLCGAFLSNNKTEE